MNKKGKIRGTKGAVLTRYKGCNRTCEELASIAAKNNNDEKINARHIYERLRRAKFPGQLNDELAKKILAPVADPKNWDRGYTLLPDGIRYYGSELQTLFGVPQSTLATIKAKTGKTEYTREELALMSRESRAHVTKSTGENWGKLSSTENTGAGRREIPDEIWLRDWVSRGNRASNLSRAFLNLPSVSRGKPSDSIDCGTR